MRGSFRADARARYPARGRGGDHRTRLAAGGGDGRPLHLCHVSTAGGVQLLREAKARGVRATGEAMPHHLALTDEWVAGGRAWAWEKPYHPGWPSLDPLAKVNPPLRTSEDAAAVLAGLKDGTLDCLGTDHAPHTMEEKAQDLATAPSGFTASETALPTLMAMVKAGLLTIPEIVRASDGQSGARLQSAGWRAQPRRSGGRDGLRSGGVLPRLGDDARIEVAEYTAPRHAPHRGGARDAHRWPRGLRRPARAAVYGRG